ncbi:MAG TPA: 30S ribosomal protein S12 methylthiotransferase RimO [Polyangiaceae bacterium]|jgi:ribosomal protein S12 methylthiotransferase|nr:30S ribosomal protein S12 methylthiotransferase RimO [Polyangiaceae bacterium]
MSERKIHFVSLGCVKNRVDTEVMLGVAGRDGWRVVEEPDEAEVIVVNTCGFIGEAKKESIDTIFELAEYKKIGACQKLVVSGCLSQRYPTELAAQMPEVDHFLGSSDMLKLEKVLAGDADRMLVGNPADWVVRATDPRVVTQSRASAWLKIAEGCDRSCAFCVIPSLRGKQRSRAADDVVAEAERLVAAGAVELNLVSQDTVAWGRDLARAAAKARPDAGVVKERLADLVRRVAEVKGVRWVRVFYLYPETLDDALIELLGQHPRVVPYVDMPLQHASDAMLKRMRRGHGKDRQRRVVERLRTQVPGLTFRTAFIVGHPGETAQDFQELCDFVTWAQFEHAVVFRYSDEETCTAYGMADKVPALTSANRARKLLALQRGIARKKNKALIGKEMDVLVEGASEEHELVMKGRHAGQAPDIDGSVYLSEGEAHAGEMRRVRVVQASDFDLVGDLIDAGTRPPEAQPPPKRVTLKVLGGASEPRWQ